VPHLSDRWHRSDRLTLPVRPVANSRCTTKFQEALVTPLVPGTKTTTKEQPAKKESPLQNVARQLQTSQELDNMKTEQHHMSTTVPRDKTHQELVPIRPVKSTDQTGHAWVAQDEQRPQVNSPKTNSRSPESLDEFVQDFRDSRNTSWALQRQDLVHQILLNREKSKKNPTKNASNPRYRKPQNRAPLLIDLGGESKGKEPRMVHAYIPHQIPKRKAMKLSRGIGRH
jgi:hypothetical protein